MVHAGVRKCVICREETTKMSRTYNSGKDNCNPNPITCQLSVIFFLRKFVQMPQQTCAELLQEFGNPNAWIFWCDSCSVLVDKAKSIYKTIEQLEKQFQTFRIELKERVEKSELQRNAALESQKEEKSLSEREPAEIVRNFIGEAKYQVEDETNLEADTMLLRPKTEIPETCPEVQAGDPFLQATITMTTEFSFVPLQTISKSESPVETSNNPISEEVSTSNTPTTCSPAVIDENAHVQEESALKNQNISFEGSRIKCSVCDKTFGTKKSLNKHFKVHSGPNLHPCKECDKKFDQYSELHSHREIHQRKDKSNNCSYCGKVFQKPSKLKRHELTHTGEKPFICPTCGKGFNTTYILQTHQRTHTKERPYVCSKCGKDFSDRSSYRRHETSVHSGATMFPCSFCKKKCPTKRDLKTHERIHTGEKPFKCRICDQGFSQHSSLKTHERSMHLLNEPYFHPKEDAKIEKIIKIIKIEKNNK